MSLADEKLTWETVVSFKRIFFLGSIKKTARSFWDIIAFKN